MVSSGRRFVLCFALCLTTGATLTPALASDDVDVGGDAPIDRFRRVDARLYRGAQPDAEGFRYLQQLGVQTVINLREEADAVRTNERRIVESLGMRYVSLPVSGPRDVIATHLARNWKPRATSGCCRIHSCEHPGTEAVPPLVLVSPSVSVARGVAASSLVTRPAGV